MVGHERLTPLIMRVLAPNPSMMTLSGTNSYLVGKGQVVVVDPGPDMPEHVEAIVEAVRPLGTLTYSLVTHHHGDHLPAAARLRERLGARIAGHRDLPGVDRALAHDERVMAGRLSLRALATAGHTADHMCYLLEDEQVLFTGDLIAGSGTVIVGDVPGDLVDYMQSLQLVATLGASRLMPGHGPVVEDPSAKIREYLDHRTMRERQVVAALSERPCTVDALVGQLYADTPTALHRMAARNVRAQLWKLEHEGRATADGGTWQLTTGGTQTS